MAECRERVGGGTITYQCMLDDGHRGPHAAVENSRSLSQRRKWEDEAREAAAVVEAHGGRPLTFAQNIGEGPGSPVPGSNLQPKEYREANPGSASPPEKVTMDRSFPEPFVTMDGQPAPPEPDEHEQALPTRNERESIQALLIKDIEARTQIGIQRYGTPLQAFNGRDAIRDAYEEALDLATYFKQVSVEKADFAERLRALMEEGFVYVPGDEGFVSDLMGWLSR